MPAWRCFSQGFHSQLGMCVEDLPLLSVPALGSELLQSGVAAALILSPLGLCLSGPAIALFELFLQFFALEHGTGTAMILL